MRRGSDVLEIETGECAATPYDETVTPTKAALQKLAQELGGASSQDLQKLVGRAQSSQASSQASASASAGHEDVAGGEQIGARKAFLHLVKGNVGPGCLSFAHAASQFGLVPSLVMLALVVAICLAGWHMIWQCKVHTEAGGARTFGDIGERAFGRAGRDTIEVLVVTTQLAVCCVFFSFFATNLHAMLPAGTWLAPQLLMLFGLPFFLFAGSLRNLKVIVPFSLAANAALAAGFGIVLYCCGQYAASGGAQAPLRGPNVSGGALFFATAVYALEGVALILPIENAVAASERRHFGKVMNATALVLAATFTLVLVLPLTTFGYVESASLTAELRIHYPGSAVVDACNLLLVVNVALTYPLQFVPCQQVVEGWVRNTAVHRGVMLVDGGGGSDSTMTAAGGGGGVGDGVVPAPVCFRRCPCTPGPAALRHLLQYPWLRWYLVLFTMVLAAAVPNLGLLIALFGSVASTSLGLVLPPQMYLRLVPGQTARSRAFCHFVTAVGVVGAVLGFVVSMSDIVHAYS